MQFLLLGIGSAGDVHPFVGLALALRRRGHEVAVAANGYFRGLVERVGLPFVEAGSEALFRQAIADPDSWHPHRGPLVVLRWMAGHLRPMYEMVLSHATPGKTIVVASTLGLAARLAQEKHGLAVATVHLSPMAFVSYTLPPVYAGLSPPSWAPNFLRRLYYWLGDVLVIDPAVGRPLNALRAELGLPRVRRIIFDWIHSPQRVLGLFPDWFGPPQPDWPPQVRLTGFPLYDERGATPLPEGLEAFLADGAAPVVFTPGSAMVHGRDFFAAAVDACRRRGCRGLLLTRFAEQVPANLPAGVRHFDYAPFSELLPRCAALVHHGGIGTTSQALAAGIPHLVMPMSHDQPDNAARLQRLGVAASLPRKHFRGPAVAARLDGLLGSADVRARCRQAAERIAQSDPLGQACQVLEQMTP